MMCLKTALIYLLLNISMLTAENQDVQHLDRLGNLTVKYGSRSEIHFEIKDHCRLYIESQHIALRAELNQMFEKQNQQLTQQMATINSNFTLASAQYPSSCAEATALSRRSGVYLLQLPGYSVAPFIASCDEHTQGGGWTVVLRRQDGSVDFYLYWQDFKHGIGNAHGEFFIGLDKLHALTNNGDQELLVIMENSEGVHKYAKYDYFAIGDEMSNYKLTTLGMYSGDAGDSLRRHEGMSFSTRDRDVDALPGDNCAVAYTGGWWYEKCHNSNLMGNYNDSTYGKGINWFTYTGHNASLKRVEMLIRKRRT